MSLRGQKELIPQKYVTILLSYSLAGQPSVGYKMNALIPGSKTCVRHWEHRAIMEIILKIWGDILHPKNVLLKRIRQAEAEVRICAGRRNSGYI